MADGGKSQLLTENCRSANAGDTGDTAASNMHG